MDSQVSGNARTSTRRLLEEREPVATFAAVEATSSALLGLLKAAAYGHAEFGTAEFPLLRSNDLQKSPPDRLAVSLYLYHVAVNPNRRALPGPRTPERSSACSAGRPA
jgi:hypothetical protein